MFSRLIFILLFSFLSAFSSFSQDLTQNKKQSKITFKIKNLGFNVNGSFKEFVVKSKFNFKDLKESFLNVEISAKSIFTDSESRDNHLLKSDFFDVKKHPTITFKSSKIEKSNQNKFILTGLLIIKGIEKKFKVPIEVSTKDKDVKILANFSLNRRHFGVGGSSFVLSKKVKIKMIIVGNIA